MFSVEKVGILFPANAGLHEGGSEESVGTDSGQGVNTC